MVKLEMKYPRITSTSNPHVKDSLNLMRKRLRQGTAMIPIEGLHLIEMALDSGAGIEKVFFTESLSGSEKGKKMLGMIPKKSDCFFEVSEKVMDRLADTDSPQGIVAVVSYSAPRLEEVSVCDRPLVTVVDGVQDPGNLGTIIRTADAAGADAVVLLPGTCDPFMPKPLRASAGSVFNIPVVQTEIGPLLKWVKDRGLRLAVTSPDAAETLFDTDLTLSVALAFGNEAHGVSTELREAADLAVKIPIYGKAESLNVGSAAAICLYEAARQRRRAGRG
jgi:RNA methyltransferase, TrmH family